MLRCRRESYRQAWAAMTLVTAVGGQRPCSIGVLRVSGKQRAARVWVVAFIPWLWLFFSFQARLCADELPTCHCFAGSVSLCREDAWRILVAVAGVEEASEEAREYQRQLEAAVTGV